MASVLMDRGNSTKMNNTPYTNGMIFFNTDDKCIYLDDGNERIIFGGQIQRINNVASATDNNVFTAKAVVDNFVQKNNVADNANNINSNTQINRPVGCTGFKEIIGTDNISGIGTTVKNSIVKLNNKLEVYNNQFYFDYHNGQWGFNTSESRGADTFHPFNSTQMIYYYDVGNYYHDNPLHALNVGVNVATTIKANCKNLPINLTYGTSAITYASAYNTSQYVEGYSGDVIHIFNDGIGSGNLSAYANQHYVCYKRDATVTTCSAVSPLAAYKTTATIGMPFAIKKLHEYSDEYYRDDDLYYYLCNNNEVKIYKYIVSSLYKDGTWIEQTNAKLTLTTDSNISQYRIGDRNKVVVYHDELYIFGGSYVSSGTTHSDNRVFIWNPITQAWRFMEQPSECISSQYYVVNNDMLCAIYMQDSNPSLNNGVENIYCCRFNGTTWESRITFSNVNQYYTIKSENIGVCVDYNGEIHFLSDKQHFAFNFLASTTQAGIRQYATLAFSLKNGCACAAIPFDTKKIYMNEKYVENIPKLIHYFSTTQPNSDSASIRKYHRTLQDTYYLALNNTDNNSYVMI